MTHTNDPQASRRERELAPLRAGWLTNGARGVLDASTGSSHCDATTAWCLAMTAVYGPGEIHESRTDDRGRPTAECRRQFPSVDRAMVEAEQKLADLLG